MLTHIAAPRGIAVTISGIQALMAAPRQHGCSRATMKKLERGIFGKKGKTGRG